MTFHAAGAKEAEAAIPAETLKASPLKKGPSLVNLSQLAGSSQPKGSDTGEGQKKALKPGYVR